MSVAIAGRGTVDLAVGPLLAFINVTVVQLNDAQLVTAPIPVFVLALGIGLLYQFLFAIVIIYIRVQPIIVALSGFLALSGINLVILPRPGGTAPEWMASWGSGTSIFSPIFLIILIATGGWLIFTASPFYKHLRLMGYDERAAYTSGVKTNAVRIGAHLISGLFVGLGALSYTALIASGDPTQGTTMSLTAVTAVVLGGVSLSGGRGSVIGALLGALNLFLIGYVLATFNFGSVQAFVTQMSYGLILVLSLLLTLLVPVIARHISFISPFSAFIVLGALVLGIVIEVGTYQLYVTPAETSEVVNAPAMAATGDITSRYFLSPVETTGSIGFALTSFQKLVAELVVTLALGVFALRITVAEAVSRRFGAFVQIVIALLILGMFAAFYASEKADQRSPLSEMGIQSQ
jgi:ribose transport system permease protein